MGLYTVFDVDGVIIMSGGCPDGEEYLYQGTYYGILKGVGPNPAEYYVDGIPGTSAVGTITMTGIATADETFIVDTQTFTWVDTRSGVGEVTIGADAPEAVTNIVTAITADLTTVTASDGMGDTVVVTAVIPGVAGNTVLFSENSTNMAMNGSGFLGGTTLGTGREITEKPLLTTVATWDKTTIDADGVEAATLGTGLPNPTNIFITIVTAEGAEFITPFDATTGSLVIKSNVVGVYQVMAMAEGYKSYVTTITAVAP